MHIKDINQNICNYNHFSGRKGAFSGKGSMLSAMTVLRFKLVSALWCVIFSLAISLYHTYCYFGGFKLWFVTKCVFVRLIPTFRQTFMSTVQSEIPVLKKQTNNAFNTYFPFCIYMIINSNFRTLDAESPRKVQFVTCCHCTL